MQTAPTDVSYLFLLAVVPFAGALLNGLFGYKVQNKHGKRPIHLIAIAAAATTFVISVKAFLDVKAGGPIEQNLWPWFNLGEGSHMKVDLAFRVDQLTSVMLLIVSGVGSLIHVFSTGYMQDEKPYWRYFAWLNLFMGMMLILITGDSFLLMFVGWEGVGLASYLLIGYYYEELPKAQAGMKAFLVNRVGDFAFVVGMAMIFWAAVDAAQATNTAGSILRFADLSAMFQNDAFVTAFLAKESMGVPVIHLGCILLFIGATGKSAQIPLYVWLPDAMAGPTPVSALIHAATMVTAGVYMIVRLSFLFSLSTVAMTVIAVIGCLTALFAATIGFFQTDIKRVLAYSTVSQLGYMFLGVGVGAFGAGIFHLMTHAFFKACLFLGSGSIIYAMHHRQDMKDMGGLRKILPVTFWTFFISTLAIAGIPGLSGFFSKDEILWRAYDTNNLLIPGEVLWVVGVIAAACTAFYMFRLVFQVFFNEPRADEHTLEHAHEHKAMTIPLVVLAVLAIGGGYLGLPAWTGAPNLLDNWMEPVTEQAKLNTTWKTDIALGHAGAKKEIKSLDEKIAKLDMTTEQGQSQSGYLIWRKAKLEKQITAKPKSGIAAFHSHAGEFVLMGGSVLLALLAIFAAWRLYGRSYRDPDNERALFGEKLHNLLLNKYFVDEIYSKFVIKPAMALMRATYWLDKTIVDGLVNLSALIMKVCAWIIGSLDGRIVDGLVNGVASGCRVIAGRVRTIQTGRVQNYILAAVVGTTVLILVTFIV
ncbi:MAG: NADH-quinone oxidoreductase subunit L [Myxococcales bacterium]|nr:NADH-quinone oxidoreductase subunit L [Myxococcales bacterium]